MGSGLSQAVFDSVILIDHLNHITPASETLAAIADPVISIITWIEVMAGARSGEEEERGRVLLSTFRVEPVSPAIAAEAARIRRERRLKLPDAIILATAHQLGVPLITRNTKDFDATAADILVPYTL